MANTSRNFDGNNTSNQITTFFHQKIRCSQCCQIVFVKMRKKIVKMREKMRQPKMSTILSHFWAF